MHPLKDAALPPVGLGHRLPRLVDRSQGHHALPPIALARREGLRGPGAALTPQTLSRNPWIRWPAPVWHCSPEVFFLWFFGGM